MKALPLLSTALLMPWFSMFADVASSPLKKRATGSNKTLFTALPTAQTGIDFANQIIDGKTHPMRRLYASSMVVGGVAVGEGLLNLGGMVRLAVVRR